jgi:hypothetical protein
MWQFLNMQHIPSFDGSSLHVARNFLRKDKQKSAKEWPVLLLIIDSWANFTDTETKGRASDLDCFLASPFAASRTLSSFFFYFLFWIF